MEDGPAKRTRSSNVSKESLSKSPLSNIDDEIVPYQILEDTVFKTPKQTRRKKRSARTPSGNNTAEDIRVFFQNCLVYGEKNSSVNVNKKILSGTDDSQFDQPCIAHSTVPVSQCDTGRKITHLESASASVEPTEINDQSNNSFKTTKEVQISEQPIHLEGAKAPSHYIPTPLRELEIKDTDNYNIMPTMDKYNGLSSVIYREKIKQDLINIRRKNEQYKKENAKHMEAERQHQCELQQVLSQQQKTNQEQNTTEIQKGTETKVMDVQLVMEMFREIKAEISSNKVIDGNTRLAKVEKRQDTQAQEVLNLKSELEDYKLKTQVLTGVVMRMSDVVQESERRMELLELNNMKKSIVFTGMNTDRRKRTCIDEVYHFLAQEMALENVTIDDVFYLNKETTSPMVLTMATMDDKKQIFRNSAMIKDLVNERGASYYFSDYLPQTTNEEKRRERDLFKIYSADDSEVKVEWKGGKLIIDDSPYTKGITPPGPKEILQATPQEMDEAFNMKLTRGRTYEEDHSIFYAYTATANTTQDVKLAYLKLKLTHPDARHIVCSFRVPGMRSHENDSYCDDNETNAGRTLLKWLADENLTSRMVFVVRQYGGRKIGNKRFQLILQAAQSAVNADGIVTTPLQNHPGTYQPPKPTENIRGTRGGRRPRRSYTRPSQSKKRGTPQTNFGRGTGNRRLPRVTKSNNQRQNRYEQQPVDYQQRPEYIFTEPITALDQNEWPSPEESISVEEKARAVRRQRQMSNP